MTLIGISKLSFKAQDGSEISGKYFYLSAPIDKAVGTGVSAERIFLSDRKLADMNSIPSVGNEVEVLYNKYGKVTKFIVID